MEVNPMDRPYVVYHMLATIDNKVTGYFMQKQETSVLRDYYFQMHNAFRADAFLFERSASEKHLISEQCDTLPEYSGAPIARSDSIVLPHLSTWAVIVDPTGSLLWKESTVQCSISCYNGAQLLVVLTEDVSDAYLSYLRERNISYLFCGQHTLNRNLMLRKLRLQVGVRTLLLEGSIALSRALVEDDLVDELSLIIAPCIEGPDGLSAFDLNEMGIASISHYHRASTSNINGHGIWMRYRHEDAQESHQTQYLN